jgi:hypothetical protein
MIDPCPTGLCALERSHMHHLPLAVWMAAQRHFEHARRHPKMAAIFEEAIADIEVMGLLKQAEAVKPHALGSAATSPVPENNKQPKPTNNMTITHITRPASKPSAQASAPQTPTPAPDDTISKIDKELTAESRRSTPAFKGAPAQPAPAPANYARLLFLSGECLRLTELLQAAEQKITRAHMSATIAMESFHVLGSLFRKKDAEIQKLKAELAEAKTTNSTLLKALHRAETAAAAHAASH